MPKPHWREWGWKLWWAEIRSQLIDQPLHALWAYATTLAPFLPWLWLEGPALDLTAAFTFLASCMSAAWITLREISQYPSRRWWDPWADGTAFVLGGLAGLGTGAWLVIP